MNKILLVLFANMVLATLSISAQDAAAAFNVPTTNSQAIVKQRVAATDIEIAYHRPNVRDRTIFGALVPYGKVWRTGSDAATKISFSTPVSIQGIEVDSGTYEIFTIPDKDKWLVILQESRSQWGSYTYDPEYDVLRVEVTPVILQHHVETFTIGIDEVSSRKAYLNISWAQVRVPVELTIDLEATVLPRLEDLFASDGRRPYFLAAMFYFENAIDIDRAAELMALAIEQRPGHIGMLYRQALILERAGDIAGAISAAELSLAGASESSTELREEYTTLNSQLLKRLKAR